ncbi:MAG: peptidoglycan DD-metalloendopeptidase family protein [Oscillospiraceae bacterium]|nr:peptidoglycan DD-metalloendopeptidase family protein [Oscillospiraceae bacterium]
MKKRRVFVSVVAVFLALLMLFSLVASALGFLAGAVSQSDVDQLQNQKTTLNQQKNAKKAALDALRTQQAGFVEMKAALDEKNELAQQEILVTEEQIAMYNEMIAEKEAEAQAAQAAADEQLELYKVHLRAMEENGTFNFYLSVLFGAKDFGDLLARIDMITEIMEKDKAVEDSYKEARDYALEIKAEYEAYKAELDAKKAELEAEVELLKAEIAEAGQMIADLQKDIDAYTAEYNQMEANERAVQAQIDELTRQMQEEERRRQEEAAANNTTPPTNPAVTGSYQWPATSTYITSKYGNRVHPIFGTKKFHSGVDVGAGAGTNVTAADGGTVSVATYSSSYGNYVMIYHADGTSTLYAHMSALAVSQGQTVNKGDVLGYVGDTGWANGPHLHFEVRVNGSTTDPLAYFGLGFTYADDA